MGEENRRRRIILIGNTGAGKTTLCQYINHEDIRYYKTQTVQVINQTIIDTPGEYLAYRYFRGAMMVTACDADVVVLVQDATAPSTMFPPSYASLFGKPAMGVVTKADLATEEQIEKAKEYLVTAGATKLFVTSSVAGTGFEEFLAELGYDH